MDYSNTNHEKIKSLKSKEQQLIAIKNYIKNLTEEQKMKFWIKTLFSSYLTFPEIIKTLDKIIELQATSVSFATEVFNKDNSAISQVERVIDLTERKSFLLNIYVMTKGLFECMPKDKLDFLEKKFVYGWSAEELAKEQEISTRKVYRRIEKILDEIYHAAKSKNWSLRFLESQIKNESWLKERFFKQVADYYKSLNYNLEKEL